MKLYELKRGSRFRIVSKDPVTPPGAKLLEYSDVLTLDHIDGMYSLCTDSTGEIVHPAAFTEVKEVEW